MSVDEEPRDHYHRLKHIVEVISADTALLIYIYLIFYGKSNPGRMWEKLEISKATGFRHLSELERVGFVEKYQDDTVEDKRYNTFYKVKSTFDTIMKKEALMQAIQYTKEHDPEFYETWHKMQEQFLARFNQIATEIFQKMVDLSDEPRDYREKIERGKHVQMSFLLDGAKNPQRIQKVRSLIQDFIDEAGEEDKQEKLEQGIKKPVYLTIHMLEFDERDDE